MWAPGRIPAGTTSDAFTSTMDLLPSIAALSRTTLPRKNKIDGFDISKTITGDKPSPRKEMLYYSSRGDLEGILQGNWKYLMVKNRKNKKSTPVSYLFNLADDISESKNLIDQYPEKASILAKRTKEIDAEITANMRPVWRKSE